MGELTTMEPDPAFDADAHEETVSAFEAVADDLTVRVWGGDWCGDCRSQLPGFGAALDAAGVEDVHHYPVEKEEDGSKTGPEVEAYGVELIPTIVLELDGEEVARFVEEEPLPPAQYLAERLREEGLVATN
jgi:thiol-disulfide isomerase/thioredoxin